VVADLPQAVPLGHGRQRLTHFLPTGAPPSRLMAIASQALHEPAFELSPTVAEPVSSRLHLCAGSTC